MKLRTLIVDDEAPAREKLKRMLSNHQKVEVIGEAEDGLKAVQMIEQRKPDLVLLDIQMPGLDGFEVIKMLEHRPLIIFVTAYDQYAIQAFEVNALDYLLKPFGRPRLEKAIDRAYQEFSRKSDFSSKIDALLETLSRQALTEQRRYLERVAVRERGKIVVIEVQDIDWINAEEGLVFLHVGKERYIAPYTLDEFERRLHPDRFFRCHRSAIINLSRVKEIVPWVAGSYKIHLSTGEEVDLSRNRARELRKIMGW